MLVGYRALGVALAVRLDVAEITNMASLVGGSTVGLAVRVDYKPPAPVSTSLLDVMDSEFSELTVRAGRGAAVGVVTKGVDVEASLGVGVVAGDVPGDGGGRRLGRLLKHNGAGDLGVSTEDSDYAGKLLAQEQPRSRGLVPALCIHAVGD